jgi:hypothetical protein
MTGHAWLDVIISVSAALVLSWLALIVALAIRRPKWQPAQGSPATAS